MKWLLAGAGVSIAVMAGAIWYSADPAESARSVSSAPEVTADSPASAQSLSNTPSPFAIDSPDDAGSVANMPAEVSGGPPPPPSLNGAAGEPFQQMPRLDLPLNDQQYLELVNRLRNNPAFLQVFIDEFRQETDPLRKQQLARVLGEVGGEQMVALASELIFSGDPESRTVGMNLLQEVQPGNTEARTMVSNMLATEVEPVVLVEALTALADPGSVDSQNRAFLADQIASLTAHNDSGVRAISINILSRWSTDGQHTEVLLAGLDDSSRHVRTAAAYALVDHEDKSPLVVDRLMTTLRDTNEEQRVRRAAIQALRNLPLSAVQIDEVDALERQVNTVSR